MTEAEVEHAVAAIRAGKLAVIPTDTVYGLVCTPWREDSVHELCELKGRSSRQPIALVAATVDVLFECVPELRAGAAAIVQELLPGPYTLVIENPTRRFSWLAGARPDTLGVRVPAVVGAAHDLLEDVGAVAATSANLHRGVDPRRLADVPEGILSAVAVALDGGELPGIPSTVLDLTAAEPRVLREGVVSAAEALARVAAIRDL
jgi:L-threonylcarbamoyladenylate synthase